MATVVVVVVEERVRHRRWWLCCRWWRRHGLVPVFARPLPVAHERLTPTLTASRRSQNRRQKRARGKYENARLVDCGRSAGFTRPTIARVRFSTRDTEISVRIVVAGREVCDKTRGKREARRRFPVTWKSQPGTPASSPDRFSSRRLARGLLCC